MVLFIEWLYDNGFNVSNSTVYEEKIENMGSGLITKNELKNNDNGNITLVLPMPIVIFPKSSLHVLKSCSCTKTLKSWLSWINVDGLRILYMFLFHEKIIGRNSKFYPYFAHIPQNYNNFLYFNKNEILMLPNSLRNHAKRQRRFIKDSLKFLKADLQSISDHHNSSENIESTFNWSYSTVNSRCVYCPSNGSLSKHFKNNNVILVPYFDLLNHKFGSKAEIMSDEKSDSILVKTYKDYSPGDQLFIDYGPHSNTNFLLEYGFVCDDNPNELIYIMDVFYQLFNNQYILKSIEVLKCINILPVKTDDSSFNISIAGFSYCSILLIELIHRYRSGISVSPSDVYLWDEDELKMKNESIISEIIAILRDDLLSHLNKLQSISNCSENLQIIKKFIDIRLDILNKL